MSLSAGIEPRVLREYQNEAVAAVQSDWDSGLRRVGVVLPTGSGKSTVIGKIASDAYHQGKRIVMLAHRGELLDQMIRDLKAVDPSIPDHHMGIVQAGRNDHYAPIVAATLQTLGTDYRRRSLGPRDVILWDEVHHAGAEGWHDTFTKLGGYEDAIMAGFTATMARNGNSRIGLGDVIEKISYEKSLRWAIDEGFLVQPHGLTVRIENLNSLNDIRNVAGDFHQGQLADVMEAATEYVVDAIKLHAADRRPIIFAASVAASQAITVALNDAGISAEATTGGTHYEDRKGIYERYRSGQTQMLVTVMVLTEGADFPECDSVVLARPTRSNNLYSQMVGRALRPFPGKEDALVLDLSGSSRHMRLVNLSSLDPGAPVRTVNELGELMDLTDEEWDDEPAEPRQRVRRQGPVDMVSIDLLGGALTTALWLETPAGVPFISVGRTPEIVFLWPEGGRKDSLLYAVGRMNTRSRSGGWVGPERYLPVAQASEIAELYIQSQGHAVPQRSESWRRSQAPSEAQMRVARTLHIPGYEGMTKAALSDEISVVFASRCLDSAMEKVTA